MTVKGSPLSLLSCTESSQAAPQVTRLRQHHWVSRDQSLRHLVHSSQRHSRGSAGQNPLKLRAKGVMAMTCPGAGPQSPGNQLW